MLKICDIQQFAKKAESLDEVICYGAGRQMECFYELFRETNVLKKCSCVADQDTAKQGKEFCYRNFVIPIISLEKMKSKRNLSCAIVITCEKFEEIVDFFEKDKVLGKIDFYCLYYFKLFEQESGSMSKKVPSDFKLYKDPVIPKVLHYCWFGGTVLPDRYKRWMESWHRFCPDYEIKEWNESNYDITKNKYMMQAYENKKWGFVPDYARLDIIYEHGGIYLDTDVELVANLDDLLYQDGFICFERETRVNCGMGFGAVKGLKIIKEMRDDYDARSFVKEGKVLDLTASPYIQTAFLEKRGLKANGDYQMVEHLTVYPEKVMGGKNLLTRKISLLPYTKAIHHFDGSWLDEKVVAKVHKMEQSVLLGEQDNMGQ